MELNILEVQGKDEKGILAKFNYCGIKAGLTYIQPFISTNLFSTEVKIVREDTINENELDSYIKNSNTDLLIVATGKEKITKLKKPQQFIMPFRIHQTVETKRGWKSVLDTISKRENQRAKKQVEKYGLKYFITKDEKDYFEFYESMHEPTMKIRYDGLARSVEKNKAFEEIFKKGLLFLITSNGLPVSGSVSQIDKNKNWLNARLIGVLDGDAKYRNIGAQNFVYHSILHWACHDGKIDVVDFQGCEPFLSKGTFQYKKRFGTSAILPPNEFYDKRLLVQINRKSSAVKNFFINNPVMLIDEQDNLGAGYFYDHNNEPKLEIPYKCNGFKYEKILNLDKRVELLD